MESAQRELISALLEHVCSIGLLSKSTYLRAKDLVHSTLDIPELFQYPVCLEKEVDMNEYNKNPQ